jgi:hypothetical protein
MCERYGEPPENSVAAKALKSSVNLLSIIFAQIYFPTYSNGLKEIAKYLGFNWGDPSSSGLQSLVWRYQWEQSCDPMWQEKLLTLPKAKPPAMPEDSKCFTYEKDLLNMFDRSKHEKETFHDQYNKSPEP